MPGERKESEPEESILNREFVEVVLDAAKLNLAKDGELVPALFLRLEGGEQLVVVLENFPAGSDEKRLYLSALGIALDGTGRRVAEAVFLFEAWYVEEGKRGASCSLAPSRHPARQEAIVVMGRDAQRSRLTHVLQPFQRDGQNQPVFAQPVVAEYNIPAGDTPQAGGLLDHLFV